MPPIRPSERWDWPIEIMETCIENAVANIAVLQRDLEGLRRRLPELYELRERAQTVGA